LKAGQEVTIAKSGCTPPSAVEGLPGSKLEAVSAGVRKLKPSKRAAVTIDRSPPEGQNPAVTPIAGARVLTDQPAFTWPPDSKAKTYRVDLAFTSGRKLWEKETTEPRLAYPAQEKPLPRDREYTWRVWAVNPDEVRPLVTAGFYVPSAREAAELEKVQALARSADPADRALAALTYEAYEVYDQALALYERLRQQAPKQPVFHTACAVLYEQAGRQEEAEKAWAEAEKLGVVRPVKKDKGP
jgi:hypothetical protein